MTAKLHWKVYCKDCECSFIYNEFILQCVFCKSTNLNQDYVLERVIVEKLETDDFQEFCNEIFNLLTDAADD